MCFPGSGSAGCTDSAAALILGGGGGGGGGEEFVFQINLKQNCAVLQPPPGQHHSQLSVSLHYSAALIPLCLLLSHSFRSVWQLN